MISSPVRTSAWNWGLGFQAHVLLLCEGQGETKDTTGQSNPLLPDRLWKRSEDMGDPHGFLCLFTTTLPAWEGSSPFLPSHILHRTQTFSFTLDFSRNLPKSPFLIPPHLLLTTHSPAPPLPRTTSGFYSRLFLIMHTNLFSFLFSRPAYIFLLILCPPLPKNEILPLDRVRVFLLQYLKLNSAHSDFSNNRV